MDPNQKSFNRKREELTTRVSLHSAAYPAMATAIEISGQVLTPDRTRAYVEFYLSHAFPVVTSDNAAIHPKVVANSYASMLHQVFDLAHLIVEYNPEENPRDRILGSVVGVELSPARTGQDFGVGTSKSDALGIRAAAVMHRQAEGAKAILESYETKRLKWTVSMEVDYWLDNSGFAVAGKKGVEKWVESTPEDIGKLGYVYVPFSEAPEELRACAEVENTPVQQFNGQETVLLQGGLDGFVHYKGVGLTPLGKETEARVKQVLAGRANGWVDMGDAIIVDLAAPLRKTLEVLSQGTK